MKSKARWRYWDHRAWMLDSNGLRSNFSQISKPEMKRAYQAKMSAGAYQLWLYLQHEIAGRTSKTCPEGWILGSQQIQRETGLSRASVYRAIRQLRDSGLIGATEEAGSMRCWLKIPRDESEMNHPLAENNSGKLPPKSQNCDKAPASDPSQKGYTASPSNSDSPVSELSLGSNTNFNTRIKPGGDRPPANPELQRGKGKPRIPTELISLLHSYICEDNEEHRDRALQWSEHPESEAYKLASKTIPMRYGPPQSRIQLAGWKGTHRQSEIIQAMFFAIEWRAGRMQGF